MSVLMSMACLRMIFPEVRLHSLHDCSAHHCIGAADCAGAEMLMCVAKLCRVLPEVRLHILCDCRSQLDHRRPGHRCRPFPLS